LGTWFSRHGGVGLAVGRLDLMIIEVFSNLNDSEIQEMLLHHFQKPCRCGTWGHG